MPNTPKPRHHHPCSYTRPKRLPKKRNRPTTTEFRKATAKLAHINLLSGEPKTPAIIDLLSDSEPGPDMSERAQQRKKGDADEETRTSEAEKAQKKSMLKGRRRVVVDSGDGMFLKA